MAKSHNQFKAGLFIVISFAIAIGIFFGITSSALFNGPTHDFTVVFDLAEDVSGLAPGSEVRIGGLKVGAVQTVDVIVDAAGKPTVIATFRTPTRYELKQDAIVSIQAGLTGAVNLNITNLGTGAVASASDRLDGRAGALSIAIDNLGSVGDEVKGALQDWRPRVTTMLDDVKPRVNATLDQFKATAATADATIKQVQSKIDPGYEKYAGVADSTRGAMKGLDDILGDTKGDFRKTMSNLSATTLSLKEKIPTVMDKVAETLDGFKTTLAKTSAALDDVKAVAANAKDVTAGVRSLINGNRGRLDEIIKSANLASQNLAAASTEIRHAPWRLLYKPSENEVANQNLYDAARQFADGSRKLQDSAQALRDSMTDPATTKDSVQALLNNLDTDFAGYKKVEAALWERVRQ